MKADYLRPASFQERLDRLERRMRICKRILWAAFVIATLTFLSIFFL